MFIYTLTNFESRATIDVDFLLRGYSNSINNVKDLICKIIDTPTGNDYIDMTAKGFEEISPQRKYHGISTQIIGRIKNVRVPFNVDIGVGDVIVPKAEQRKINTQLPDFEAPVIKTYSLESTIAEKFDAILQRFELTGRMKDFYDIYYLSRTFDFEEQNYNPLYLRPCSDVALPTTEIVLSVLSHLPKMRICKSVGNIFEEHQR